VRSRANVEIARASITTYSSDYPAMVPVMIPDLNEVRRLAAKLHARGQVWTGEAFGWPAEYNPERSEPPLDSKMTFTPADFCIGESGIWFFSLMWEHGRDAEPVEFLDDRNVVQVLAETRAPYEVTDPIDELLHNPVEIEGFVPLTRDEANARTSGGEMDLVEQHETDNSEENDTA
jgi:hypothetical protein